MSERKVAVITGASSGLGLALAREFRRNGFFVVALSRREPPAEVADAFIAADLTRPEELARAAERIGDEYGPIAVLVNNAGVGSYATWEELTGEQLRYEMELDFFVPVELTRRLLPLLAKTRGAVVNIASAASFIPVACMGAYNAAKAALRMFSVTLRMECSGRGIRVLNICPGRINTGFSSRALGGRKVPPTPGSSASGTEDFARKVFRAYRSGRRELVYPGWYRLAIWFTRCFPGMTDRMNRRVWKLGKEN